MFGLATDLSGNYLYNDLFKCLDQNKVRYLLCGGLAVNIYGVARMTADIDILLDFEIENIRKFEICAEKMFYKPTLPVELDTLADETIRIHLQKTKNLAAYSYYNSGAGYLNLDIIIDLPMSFKSLWDNREERQLGEISINLVSFDDLIELKKYANRLQDWNDIELLMKLKKEDNGK